MKNKHSYKSVITLSIFIGIILLIIFANPNMFSKSDFIPVYNESQFENIDLSENYQIKDYVETKNKFLPNSVLSLKQRGELTEEQTDEIIKISASAERSLSEYLSGGDKQDLSMALFHTQEAISLEKIYPFNNCGDNIYNLSKKYGWFFHYLSYEDREQALDIYQTKENLANFLDANRYYRENLDKLPRRTVEVENLERKYDLYGLDCRDFKNYLQKNYDRQKSFFLLKLASVILIFIVGLIFGNIWSNRKKLSKKSEKVGNHLTKMFNPKTIKDDAIKSILKISSVSTTIVAFLGIVLTISGFKTLFVMGLILMSILPLLSSMLLGIIALNNTEEIYKKWCYRLFVFGLGFFIFFFAYLLFGGILVEFFKTLGESAQTYLNNQTAIK